ncbi:GNAT family N-acetyltransferase [Halobaculum magnesiiphilum]|uniref:GNAT family N-acetyltransferase n=1 Tax=Halobaculum magnesiiphilum TaxID=1017351 RepID=A0A8T8WCI8_9EURY|nr:GNAT family N-acetyltransferase [Halobaculum magnesiiphilum]QZP37555.1 GNAT family N-acetyltransferase [Halobaculum magnesiiphilum]
MHYSAVPDAHEDTFDGYLVYAFSPERGPDHEPEGPDRPASFHARGLYDTEEIENAADPEDPEDPKNPEDPEDLDAADLAVVCGYYDFAARIRGGVRDVAGISAVASPPEARRRGFVRELLTNVHRELREDGVAFAALWPFEYPFYRRLGYERICDYARIEVAPGPLASACPDPTGSYERLDADDWPRLDAVYDEWATAEFRLNRSEDWWRDRVFESWGTDPYVYGWTDGDRGDELRGYVVYTITDDDDAEGKTMAVSEFAHVDREARGHLLRFCRNHDSQVERVRFTGPADTRLFDGLDDPRAAETEIRPGPMVRIVDVERALEAIAYQEDSDATLVLDVRDDDCEWNDDVFHLRVADGRGAVERVAAADEVDVSLDIGALSRLVVGSHGVDGLVELGAVEVAAESDREMLATLFPETDPFLREGF